MPTTVFLQWDAGVFTGPALFIPIFEAGYTMSQNEVFFCEYVLIIPEAGTQTAQGAEDGGGARWLTRHALLIGFAELEADGLPDPFDASVQRRLKVLTDPGTVPGLYQFNADVGDEVATLTPQAPFQ